jgi:cyclopropane fatty-acyl-phospholipid synthase-like methyltransferase
MSHTPQAFENKDIIQYYQRTEWVYRNFWKLDVSMGLHFGFWNKDTKSLADAILHQNEVMASLLNIKPEHIVLDAGCGVGGSAIYLAKQRSCDVKGITITPKQIESAKQYAMKEGVQDKVDFFEMDFTNTNFPDASFDVVWAIESVCHAADKKVFLTEAYRLLKPGGQLIVADYFPTKSSFTPKEYKQVYTNGLNGWAVDEMCNLDEFTKHCKTLGFHQLRTKIMNDAVEPSVQKLILKNRIWLAPGWLYYKCGGITKTEFMNAYGAYNFCKAFSSLWNYTLFVAEK